jgi:hypothetical protein
LSRVRSARRVGPDTARVARPTSITIESANSTRDMVQSHVMRSSVRVEMGRESSRPAGGTPTSFFTPSMVVVRLMCGRAPLRRGSVPLSIAWLTISPSASCRRCDGDRSSSGPVRLASASTAVFNDAPVTGSSRPSSAYMPSDIWLMCSRRRE